MHYSHKNKTPTAPWHNTSPISHLNMVKPLVQMMFASITSPQLRAMSHFHHLSLSGTRATAPGPRVFEVEGVPPGHLKDSTAMPRIIALLPIQSQKRWALNHQLKFQGVSSRVGSKSSLHNM